MTQKSIKDEMDPETIIADFSYLAAIRRQHTTPPRTEEELKKIENFSYLYLKFIQEHNLSNRIFVNDFDDTNNVTVLVKDLTNEGFEFWRNTSRFLDLSDFNVNPENRVKRILEKELNKLRGY